MYSVVTFAPLHLPFLETYHLQCEQLGSRESSKPVKGQRLFL